MWSRRSHWSSVIRLFLQNSVKFRGKGQIARLGSEFRGPRKTVGLLLIILCDPRLCTCIQVEWSTPFWCTITWVSGCLQLLLLLIMMMMMKMKRLAAIRSRAELSIQSSSALQRACHSVTESTWRNRSASLSAISAYVGSFSFTVHAKPW